MNLDGLIYVTLILTQTAWALRSNQNSYYELWSSRFDSVQFEMKIMRDKVTNGEIQLATMRSELESLAAACSSNTEICNKTDMRGPIAVNDVDVVDDNAVHVLKRAFMNEKLYTRKLEQWVQTALLDATNSMHQVRERINVTEDKSKCAFDEISRQITSLHRYFEMTQESQQSKHEETSKAIDRLTKDLARMNKESKQEETSKAVERLTKDLARMNQESKQEETSKTIDRLTKDLARMNQIVTNQANSIDRLGGKRCQTGAFGDHTHPGISFPKTYQVNFHPSFQSKPNFMYALHLLDSTAIVRVNAALIELNKDFAKVKINSWADTKLYGARVRWMACP